MRGVRVETRAPCREEVSHAAAHRCPERVRGCVRLRMPRTLPPCARRGARPPRGRWPRSTSLKLLFRGVPVGCGLTGGPLVAGCMRARDGAHAPALPARVLAPPRADERLASPARTPAGAPGGAARPRPLERPVGVRRRGGRGS